MENNNFVFNNGYPQYNIQRFEQLKEKKNDKKILRTIGVLCGFSIVVYFIASTLIGAIMAVLSRNSGFNLEFLYESSAGSWAFSAIATVLFIGLPFLASYLILRKKKISGILPLGTTYNKKASTYLVMMFLPLTLISTFIINFVSILVQSLMGINFSSGMENFSVEGVGNFLSMTLFVAIIPALLEEIAIRGVLLQPLRRFGDKFAIFVSALIFSLLHGNMVQVPYTIVAGIYFGYVAVATGSLWPSIILHFLNNFYSVIVTAADSNLSIGAANILSILLLGVMTIVGVFAFTKYRAMNYKVKMAKGVNSLKLYEKMLAVFINIPMIAAIAIMIITTLTSISAV